MENLEKQSVALVIWDRSKKNVLIVRRPLDDENLPGMWGFPAASKENSEEDWEVVAHRAALTKLGVKVRPIKCLGEDVVDRGLFILRLRDYEVEITDGSPKVPQNVKGVTQYMEMKYTNSLDEMIKSAQAKSLCTRIFLKSIGVNYLTPSRFTI